MALSGIRRTVAPHGGRAGGQAAVACVRAYVRDVMGVDSQNHLARAEGGGGFHARRPSPKPCCSAFPPFSLSLSLPRC